MFYALLALWFYNSVLVINHELFDFYYLTSFHAAGCGGETQKVYFYKAILQLIG